MCHGGRGQVIACACIQEMYNCKTDVSTFVRSRTVTKLSSARAVLHDVGGDSRAGGAGRACAVGARRVHVCAKSGRLVYGERGAAIGRA